MLLPTTMSLASAALLINLWLGMRIGKLRHAKKISIGDGGDEALLRRMRAQLNFIEQTPLTLIAIGLIEAVGKGGMWLAPVGAIFMLGRVAHAIGMDGSFNAGRAFGTLSGMVFQLALIVIGVLIVLGKF